MNSGTWRTPVVVLACGTATVLISFGLRGNLGLYMAPISADLGWGREVFAFAVAIQALVWGLSTPFVGFLSDRYGAARVLAAGGAIYVIGLAIMAQATTPEEATIGIGVLTGIALASTGFPIVLSVVSRIVPANRRSVYLGIASSGGSSGQLILIPLGQGLLTEAGWVTGMVVMAGIAGIIVPLAYGLAVGRPSAYHHGPSQRVGEAMREAWGHSGFRLMTAGFFVCGFQTLFIMAHLPAYLTDLGMSPWLGATALSLIGLFNIFGCSVWGMLGQRYHKQHMLVWLYLIRAVIMAAFMLVPLSPVSVIAFACCIGLTWLGTVPLMTGLIAQIFGTQYLATLSGITFVSHQIGSFLGIWLGGVFYDRIGSYDPIFWGGVAAGIAAAFVHYPIDDRPLARTAAARA